MSRCPSTPSCCARGSRLGAEQPNVREYDEAQAGNAAVDQGEIVQREPPSPKHLRSLDELLEQARRQDAAHHTAHQKLISALLGYLIIHALLLPVRDRNRLVTTTSGGSTAAYNYDPFERLDTAA